MKKSFKILIFLMAFAFMGVMTVKAACRDYSSTTAGTCTSHEGCSWSYDNGGTCSGAEQPATCPPGQEWVGGDGTCEPCREGRYSNDTSIHCLVCTGTVSQDRTQCITTTNVTVTGSAASTRVNPGNYTTLSCTTNPSIQGTCTFSGTHVSNGRVNCPSDAANEQIIRVTVGFTPTNPDAYNITPGTVNVTCLPAYDSKVTTITPESYTKYIRPNTPEGISFSVRGETGKPVKAEWSSSDSSFIDVSGCTNTNACSVSTKGLTCGQTKTVTITATAGGGSATSTVELVGYDEWKKVADNVKVPTDGRTKSEMESRKGCKAYETVGHADGYGEEWDRCCGGGTPETPACYKCGTELKWGSYASDTSCTFVSDQRSDCEETPYCYKNVNTGEYDWGNHANDSNWVKYSENKSDCEKEPEDEDPACYTKDGEYYWGKYKGVEGYTFTSLTETQCKKFCYKEKSTGDYVWGNHVGDDNYEVVASITDQTKCKAACYKCDEEVKWGPYADDSNCEEVPGVTTIDDCEVTPPPTGLSVSNILYACGAFLVIMGSGIVVYQLTRVKKETM